MVKKVNNKTFKQRFVDGLKILSKTRNPYEVWSDTMLLFATSIANPIIVPLKENKEFKVLWEKREKEYLRVIAKYDKKEQKLFPQMFSLLIQELERKPNQDLLGELYMLSGISNNKSGQFFTPYSVCDLMSSLTFDRKKIGKEIHNKGYVSIYDPTCGAGATLVSATEECKKMFKKLNFQNHVYFVGQDIDITCVHMCYIQLCLHGVAGYIIHGNTLTKPRPKSLEQIWFTPVWFNDVWTMRRMFHNQDILGGI